MAATVVANCWPSPCAVEQFKDASLYEFPVSGEWRDSTYSRIMMMGSAVLKLASSYGKSEYEKFVVQETVDNDAIRGNEALEKFVNLGKLAEAYPAFQNCPAECGKDNTHWLLLHRLQFDRLRKNISTVTAIPEARFVFLSKRRFLLSPSIKPVLVQQRVEGIPLSEMIDHDAIARIGGHRQSFVKDEYRSFLPSIASQLRPFTHRQITDHINWYIPNFIFNSQSRMLYYIDMKPSNIFGRWRNEQNLRNIKRDFLEEFS